MLSNKEIRARGRQTLIDSPFSAAWLIGALVFLALAVFSAIIGNFKIFIYIAFGPMWFYLFAYFLDRHRGKIDAKDVMAPFKHIKKDIVGIIVIGILYLIMISIGKFFFVIPGLILGSVFSLSYFVRMDNPKLGYIDTFRENWRLIKRHLWQYFMLQLSFIGWILLGMITIVGIFWVLAYIYASMAVFYEELRKADRANSLPSS